MKAYSDVGLWLRGDGLHIYRPSCPECDAMIQAQAAVDVFMVPEGWQFYGEKGKRVKVCEGVFMGYPFIHFVVKLPGGVSNRLAWFEIEGV